MEAAVRGGQEGGLVHDGEARWWGRLASAASIGVRRVTPTIYCGTARTIWVLYERGFCALEEVNERRHAENEQLLNTQMGTS